MQLGHSSGQTTELSAYLTQEEISQMVVAIMERVSTAMNFPSAENGTNLATGRFLSRMTISSSPLTHVRYLLSRFLSSAT
jgi:hypothetical protein